MVLCTRVTRCQREATRLRQRLEAIQGADVVQCCGQPWAGERGRVWWNHVKSGIPDYWIIIFDVSFGSSGGLQKQMESRDMTRFKNWLLVSDHCWNACVECVDVRLGGWTCEMAKAYVLKLDHRWWCRIFFGQFLCFPASLFMLNVYIIFGYAHSYVFTAMLLTPESSDVV